MPHEEEGDQQTLTPLEGVEHIRRIMYEGQEYWSVVDVVGFLTEATSATSASKYWYTMRSRMQSEGAKETLSQIVELPMKSADGRLRKTDAMNRLTLLRLVH